MAIITNGYVSNIISPHTITLKSMYIEFFTYNAKMNRLFYALFIVIFFLHNAYGQNEHWNNVINIDQIEAKGRVVTNASTTNSAGDIFTTGYFRGQVAFGDIVIGTGDGSAPLEFFVAKWSRSSNKWVWAVKGGGNLGDAGNSIAVNGKNIYVTGFYQNNSSNTYNAIFSGVVLKGLSSSLGTDMFLAKYIDEGTSVNLGWITAGGGEYYDSGLSLAVSGANIYVTGSFTRNALFGGIIAKTLESNEATNSQKTDAFIVKYKDTGSSAYAQWVTVEGSLAGSDEGRAIAVSNDEIYVTGTFLNFNPKFNGVFFGGVSSNVVSNGSDDIFLLKYTDKGTSPSFEWVTTGGGNNVDNASAIAINNDNIFITGNFTNSNSNVNNVQFGDKILKGSSAVMSSDIYVLKFTDKNTATSLDWATTIGGSSSDESTGIAVNGNEVFITGEFINSNSNLSNATFSGITMNGYSNNLTKDIFIGMLTDNGLSVIPSWVSTSGSNSEYDETGGVFVFNNIPYICISSTSAIQLGKSGTTPNGGIAIASISDNVYNGTLIQSRHVGNSSIKSIATENDRYIIVTGTFTGQISFGKTILNSRNYVDMFLAKWDKMNNAWIWAKSYSSTYPNKLSVVGNDIYICGSFHNDKTDINQIKFDNISVKGISQTKSFDIFFTKFTDRGLDVFCNWVKVAGGDGEDKGIDLSVSEQGVYLTGYISNDVSNTNKVMFDNVYLSGKSAVLSKDIFTTKYTNSPSPSLLWVVADGGEGADEGTSISLSGDALYTAGYYTNNSSNTNNVSVSGKPLNGIGPDNSEDIYTIKYLDSDITPITQWVSTAGGSKNDRPSSIEAKDKYLFLSGFLTNSITNSEKVSFGHNQISGISQNISQDIFIAKLLDYGQTNSFQWIKVAGGNSTDQCLAMEINNNSIYLTGYYTGTQSEFAKFDNINIRGRSNFSNSDIFICKYTDNNNFATCNWALSAGSESNDYASSIALSSGFIFTAGTIISPSYFGNIKTSGNSNPQGFIASIVDNSILSNQKNILNQKIKVYPNPVIDALTIINSSHDNIIEVDILELNGKLLKKIDTKNNKNNIKLNLSFLTKGTYLMKIITKNAIFDCKVIRI